jgi:imidazolonepropionase-like amidohydrolase
VNRREFLQYSALVAASCALPSCASLSPRFQPRETVAVRPEPLLLTNAFIIDVARGALRPERSVLLRDGRIAELLHDEAARSIEGARRLDLQGAHLTPGLINAHCHMTLPGAVSTGAGLFFAYERQVERNAEECVKHGVTTVRDMMALGNALGDLRDKIVRGEVVGPRIVRSCALDVKNGYMSNMSIFQRERYARIIASPAEGRTAVGLAAGEGADFIKLFQQPRQLLQPGRPLPMMNLPAIQAVCEEAAKHGLPVAMHHTSADGLHKGLDGRVNTLEHMARDRALTEEEIHAAWRSGIMFVPTASVAFALAYESKGDPHWGKGVLPRMVEQRKQVMPDLIREFSEPDLVDGTISLFHRFSDPSSYETRHLAPWIVPTVFTSSATIGTDNLIAMYKAGVPMGCGNDGGVPLIFPGAIYLELALLEEIGFPPADGLRTATINNARLMRLEREIGSIEPGKIADLAAFEKNPLQTVRNLKRPAMVIQGGRVVVG